MRRHGAAVLPLLMMVTAMASIQGGAALAKSLFPLAGPLGVTALRVSLAAAILWAVWRPWRNLPKGRDLGWIVLYGAALGAMNLRQRGVGEAV